MITSRNRLLWAGLLASATLAGTSAFAQAPQMPSTAPAAPASEAPTATGAPAKPQLHQRADREQRMERMRAHRAQRLAALKEKLKLSPAQDGAWKSYASAQQPTRPAGQARPDRAAIAKMTTPQRLDMMQARQAERSAMFTKRVEATRSFYAALSPEQQKTFDAESMARFEHGGHHHRGGPGHGPTPPAKS
jgi:hypothetical protein